jgi:signal transduction histidine kinase
VRQQAALIQRAAARMNRMIGDLLDLVSLRAGRLAIERRPCAPAELAREALEAAQSMATERGCALRAELEDALPEVSCDRGRVLQILSNLLGNAIKVTPAGGEIVLRVCRGGSELLFSVLDPGPGIAAEELPHLFERYRRGSEAGYKGTGLGLYISRGLVEAHRGRIWAESVPGRGSTFTFTLPLEQAGA